MSQPILDSTNIETCTVPQPVCETAEPVLLLPQTHKCHECIHLVIIIIIINNEFHRDTSLKQNFRAAEVVTSSYMTKMAVTPFNPPYPKTPSYTQTSWFYVLSNWSYCRCRNRDFQPFLFLWPWPWPNDIHIQTWPVFPGDIPDMQILTSYINVFDRQAQLKFTLCHFVGGQKWRVLASSCFIASFVPLKSVTAI